MSELNQTPAGSRLHISFFGPTNVGKSSLINRFTGQDVSIVADQAGTTTDPVSKAMEVHPLGPVLLTDTAGFDDPTSLGRLRWEKTLVAAKKCDVALIVLPGNLESPQLELSCPTARQLLDQFQQQKTPVLLLLNKGDLYPGATVVAEALRDATGVPVLPVSALTGQGMEQLTQALVLLKPLKEQEPTLLGDLAGPGDSVLLVMPQDTQAPKGRLILPQVQTIRELLDTRALVHCVTTDQFASMVACLKEPPKLVITDSQVVKLIYDQLPQGSRLTTFSILFAAWKGDIDYYVQSAHKIPSLTDASRILIAECCTHAPLEEDIGRVKIPNLLRKRYGRNIQVDVVAGADFPEDLRPYDLVIQCGGCMFNRKFVLNRVLQAKEQGVPMTNYGVAISYLMGILDQVSGQ